MSTFEGITREYPRISIDRFDGKNLASTLYILSHFHSDHTIGLASETFKERILSNPEVKVYCSEVTRSLILAEDSYVFLRDALVPLADNVPSELYVSCGADATTSSDETREPITLTLLPAGHCPGSVMCLIEGPSGRVLYTSDYRISADRFKLLRPLFDAEGNPKSVDSLYVDTTFFHPNNVFIPSRSYSLLCATEVIGHWIDQGKSKVARLKFKASLGCEHLLSAIGRHFNTKIHVSDYKFRQCSDIRNLADIFTTDPDSTQIHACDLIMPSIDLRKQQKKKKHSKDSCHCRVLGASEPEDLRTLTFSAMFFTGASTLDKYCVPVGKNHFKVCYSLHPSYGEVCQLIEALKPVKAFANVNKLGNKIPKCYDVQQELDRVVARARTSDCRKENELGKELERSLKRQFSEDSMDNFLFDETQSYLRSNSKRPRLEGYDLSADLLDSTSDPTTSTKKRKRNLMDEEALEEEDEDEDDPLRRWAKRIAPERLALRDRIDGRCRNDGHIATLDPSDSDVLDGDSCDTEEENELLDASDSDHEGRTPVSEEGAKNHHHSLPTPLESPISGNSYRVTTPLGNSLCSTSQSEISQVWPVSPAKGNKTLVCTDEVVLSDGDVTKESRSEVLVDSDVTVDLNSSVDAGVARPESDRERSDPVDLKPSKIEDLSGVSQRVVCIDLTEEGDEEEDDEENDDDDEDGGGTGRTMIHSRSRMKIDDDDDDCGYDGGDECDSSDSNDHNEERAGDRPVAAIVGRSAGDEDDSNDRTSGYDSDTPHLTELQRKSHARFEKLYKRKQRKIRIKTRRQNLRNVSKDDVIVIDDDDDDSSDTDDSYDYDSGDSSSDYDHYPGKGRGGKRSGNNDDDDTEQFLMPSMTSSSESSQTLSSEDNVVVVVNSKSQEEEEEEEDDDRGDGKGVAKKGGGEELVETPPTLVNQNGDHHPCC